MASRNVKRKGSEPKEQRRKKPKDMPRRPLSAYNLFFRAEREIIMDKYERGEDQADFQIPEAPKRGTDDAEKLDPKLIKSHNAAVFQAVARTIADRWKNMPKHLKTKYEDQAAVEMKKYRSRMEEYQEHMIKNSNISTKQHKEKLQMMKQHGVIKDPPNENISVLSTEQFPQPFSSLVGHHLNPTLAAGNIQGRNTLFLASHPEHGLTSPRSGQPPMLDNINYSATFQNPNSPSLSRNILEALEALREGTPNPSGSISLLPGFASRNVTSTHQNVPGSSPATLGDVFAASGLTSDVNPNYSSYLQTQLQLQQQFQLEQEFQAFSRLRAQQHGAIPNLTGAAAGIFSSNTMIGNSINIDPRQIGFLQNHNNGPFVQQLLHRPAAAGPISGISGTSSSTADMSPTDVLDLLEAQAMTEQHQRLRTELFLRQQQQHQQRLRNETLERLLQMGGTGVPISASTNNNNSVVFSNAGEDQCDPNGSSNSQQEQEQEQEQQQQQHPDFRR